jgi:hypothetical protein
MISKEEPLIDIFEHMRNWPKMLKCIIYGRKDNILVEPLASNTITHYTYNQQFEEGYKQVLSTCWKRLYGRECDNVQEQFVYSIEGGHHSLHIQNKYKDTVASIVDEYLTFIETTLNHEAKM